MITVHACEHTTTTHDIVHKSIKGIDVVRMGARFSSVPRCTTAQQTKPPVFMEVTVYTVQPIHDVVCSTVRKQWHIKLILITGPVAMIEVDWYHVLALEIEDPVLVVIAMHTLYKIESFTRTTLDIQCSFEPIGEYSCYSSGCVYNRD